MANPVIPVPGRSFVKTVTIANGASLSGAIDLGDYTLVGLITDSAWDTNTMSFAVSDAIGGTYVPLHSLTSGAEVVTGSIVASKWFAADPADFAGVQYLKVRSGTSAAAVNQSGATVITLICRAV